MDYKSLIFLAFFISGHIFSLAQSKFIPRKQVPVLCYHQLRDWKPKDKKADKDYIIPPAIFAAQMKMLSDSGFHTILPDELYNYLVSGKSLPPKPIMLTFDDTNEDQFKVARAELMKYNYKAIYFIITGKIGSHPWFMNEKQIRQLSDEGNVIGCHTRSHTSFKKLKGVEFNNEIAQPKKELEAITGKTVKYFAYPYGYWNRAGLSELHRYGFKAAFQLEEPSDLKDPIMTIRRIIASGYWSTVKLDYSIKHDFGQTDLKLTIR